MTLRRPAGEQPAGGQAGASLCERGQLTARWCLEAGAVPGGQTPLTVSAWGKLPCRDGSWWEPTCSLLPWGWKPLMQWQRGGSVTPAGLGPSPGAQNSQTCCSPLQHRRHNTVDSGCQQLLHLPKADGCPSRERASWQRKFAVCNP